MTVIIADRIRTLDNSVPHISWSSWEDFLATCENRGECDGVVWYGKTNCNYILFPNGMLHRNYGYHGASIMAKVAEHGSEHVLQQIREGHEQIRKLLAELDNVESRIAGVRKKTNT